MLLSLMAEQAPTAHLTTLVRNRWHSEIRLHYVRDFSHDEDCCGVRLRDLLRNPACLTSEAISIIRCQPEFHGSPGANHHFSARAWGDRPASGPAEELARSARTPASRVPIGQAGPLRCDGACAPALDVARAACGSPAALRQLRAQDVDAGLNFFEIFSIRSKKCARWMP